MFKLDTILNDVAAYWSMCSVYTISDSIERLSFFIFIRISLSTIFTIYIHIRIIRLFFLFKTCAKISSVCSILRLNHILSRAAYDVVSRVTIFSNQNYVVSAKRRTLTRRWPTVYCVWTLSGIWFLSAAAAHSSTVVLTSST